MSPPQTALIIGSTGRTGKRLLTELLAPSSGFTKVGEYGRRVTPLSEIKEEARWKLEQKTIDFEKIGESGLKDGKWDVIFITLGTTRAKAGGSAPFEKIAREYVLNAAKEAKSSDPSVSQRIVYISSAGANPTSSLLYFKSKGLTEEGLAALNCSDTIIFRPGFLKGEDRDLKDTVIGFIASVLSHFSPGFEIDLSVMAKAILNAGKLGSEKLPDAAQATKAGRDHKFTVIENVGALALGKTDV